MGSNGKAEAHATAQRGRMGAIERRKRGEEGRRLNYKNLMGYEN